MLDKIKARILKALILRWGKALGDGMREGIEPAEQLNEERMAAAALGACDALTKFWRACKLSEDISGSAPEDEETDLNKDIDVEEVW